MVSPHACGYAVCTAIKEVVSEQSTSNLIAFSRRSKGGWGDLGGGAHFGNAFL